MLFEKARWAGRIIENIGISFQSPEAKVLTDLIVSGAKMMEKQVRDPQGRRPPIKSLVIWAADTLVAVEINAPTEELQIMLGMDAADATRLLQRLRTATYQTADAYGIERQPSWW